MLRGNLKTKLIYGGTLLAIFSLTIGSAMARELAELEPYVSQLTSNTSLQCQRNNDYYIRNPSPPGGETPVGTDFGACNSCNSMLPGQANGVKSVYKSMVAKDGAANGAGSTAAVNGANNTNGYAENTQNTQSGTGAAAKAALQQKAANAKAVAAKASECVKAIEKTCKNLAQRDQSVADNAKKACQELATASSGVAADKAASSGGMGDLSQLAGALGQALGPLAQMMQGQPETPEQPGISDVDTTVDPESPPGTSFGNPSNPLAGTKIGNPNSPNGAEFKSPKNNITGFGPAGSSSGFGPSGSYDSMAGAGYDDSSSGGGNSVGAGYSSGGGGAGFNSSGSSMSPGASDAEKAAAAAAAEAAGENYEVTAGGGGKPSFLGLKSRAEEDFGSGGESVLGDLGLEDEGSRELASNEEPAGGIGEADGNTLFHVIHTKIAEIKKRGSI